MSRGEKQIAFKRCHLGCAFRMHRSSIVGGMTNFGAWTPKRLTWRFWSSTPNLHLITVKMHHRHVCKQLCSRCILHRINHPDRLSLISPHENIRVPSGRPYWPTACISMWHCNRRKLLAMIDSASHVEGLYDPLM